MSKKLLFVKNISHEDPGILEELLREHGIPFTAVDLAIHENLPRISDFNALVVLGGPQSANDQTPHILKLISYIEDWLEQNKPFLGICLGMQLLVKACGGRVFASPNKEIGFLDPQGMPYEIELTKDGQKDPLLQELPKVLPVFQLHGETVELPAGINLLGMGRICKNQVVKKEKSVAYGFQCHFELTEAMLRIWQGKDSDLRNIPYEKLLREFTVIQQLYRAQARRIFQNFLEIADFTEFHNPKHLKAH